MTDLILDIIIILAALGLLVSAAYLLQKRKKPILGLGDEAMILVTKRTGRRLWIFRGYLILLVAMTLIAILSNSQSLLWVSLGILVIGMVGGMIAELLHFVNYVRKDMKERQPQVDKSNRGTGI
jgi:hypothetical protein